MTERQKRGQFVIFAALVVTMILLSISGTIYLATNRVQQFRHSNYLEVVENMRADYARLLTYSLKTATWDRAIITSESQLSTKYNNMLLSTQLSSATYGNTATIETKVKRNLASWSNVTSLGLASYGTSLDLDPANLVLQYNWNVPNSNSTTTKKLSFNLTALGFTGFTSTYTVTHRAVMNSTNLDSQWGGGSVSYILIQVLDGNGNPKNLLGINDFYAYNLNSTNYWKTRPLSTATYQNNGVYRLNLASSTTQSRYFLVIVSDGKNILTLSSYHP